MIDEIDLAGIYALFKLEGVALMSHLPHVHAMTILEEYLQSYPTITMESLWCDVGVESRRVFAMHVLALARLGIVSIDESTEPPIVYYLPRSRVPVFSAN